MVTGQRIRGGAVAEPPQPQHRLPETRQRPAALGGAAPPALGQQQPRNEPGQFPRDVNRGTIGEGVNAPLDAADAKALGVTNTQDYRGIVIGAAVGENPYVPKFTGVIQATP